MFCYAFLNSFPTKKQIRKARISVTTIVAPVGVSARIEMQRPSAAQITERTEEQTTTALKFLKIRIDCFDIINAYFCDIMSAIKKKSMRDIIF